MDDNHFSPPPPERDASMENEPAQVSLILANYSYSPLSIAAYVNFITFLFLVDTNTARRRFSTLYDIKPQWWNTAGNCNHNENLLK